MKRFGPVAVLILTLLLPTGTAADAGIEARKPDDADDPLPRIERALQGDTGFALSGDFLAKAVDDQAVSQPLRLNLALHAVEASVRLPHDFLDAAVDFCEAFAHLC